MKRRSQIIEADGSTKKCNLCQENIFYLTEGHSRKAQNEQKTVFKIKARYIYTCCACGHKEYAQIYDRYSWIYGHEADYEAIAK